MEKPNNIVKIPTSIKDFFRYWFMFLEPFHNLTNRELDVITAIVRNRYKLSKVVKDNILLDKIALNEESKQKIREECGLSYQHFQIIMTKLRKRGIISHDNKINPKFIPNVTSEDSFSLLLYFTIEK